jgi:hypothetical protein
MRKNIFDILSEGFNIDEEIAVLWDVFCDDVIIYKTDRLHQPFEYKSILYTVDRYAFKNWKSRGTCISTKDMIKRLGINNIIYKKSYKDPNNLLKLLEFIINMISRCQYTIQRMSHILESDGFILVKENTKKLIERFGYTLYDIENEEKRIIIEKNPAATAAAEISKRDIAVKIMQYNHYLLKGDINTKKDIILALAGDIEPKEKELKIIDETIKNNLFFLLNNLNLRHNNIEPEDKNYKAIVANMTQTELESWYDETYQLILLSKLLLDNSERSKKITALRAKTKNNAD